jgi:hypothetical protein
MKWRYKRETGPTPAGFGTPFDGPADAKRLINFTQGGNMPERISDPKPPRGLGCGAESTPVFNVAVTVCFRLQPREALE